MESSRVKARHSYGQNTEQSKHIKEKGAFMKLSKFEKLVYAGSPWFFGIVLTITGTYTSLKNPDIDLYSIIMIAGGLICISLYCVCSLLIKLIEDKLKD